MEYKKIEHLIYNNNLVKRENYKRKIDYELEIDRLLFENLQKCVDKSLPIEMDELDFAAVYKKYLRLLKNNYKIDMNFIIKFANLATKELDYLGIIQEITE